MDLNKIRREAVKHLNPKTLFRQAKSMLFQFRRVLKRTKKPTRDEFVEVVKISAAGMVLIGLIGFVIQTIFLYVIQI